MEKYYQQSKGINVLPPHAYFIPFEDKESVYNNRRISRFYQDLNGVWKVQEYASILDVAENFYVNTPMDEIVVPIWKSVTLSHKKTGAIMEQNGWK